MSNVAHSIILFGALSPVRLSHSVETRSRRELATDILVMANPRHNSKAFSKQIVPLNTCSSLLLSPIVRAQRKIARSVPCYNLDNLARARHRRSRSRSNSLPCDRSSARRSKYCLCGVILLVLSFSVSHMTVGLGYRHQSVQGGPLAISVGSPSFIYASQW